MSNLLGAKTLFLIRLAWEASETQLSSTRFDQSRLNRFYLSWAPDSARLGSELGSVGLRVVVRFASGLGTREFDWTVTRGSTRFARGPDQLEARLIVSRGSAQFAIRGSAYLSSWIGLDLGLGSGLGKAAQCSAQLSSEHGWRIVETPGGAFRLVTLQFKAFQS